MSINVNDKNLGHATAYAYYKAGGGTMTEAEFTEFMADFGTASQTAVEAAQAALASETAAQTAATTATNKATEATTAATTATNKAAEAQADADAAALDASQAMSAASTATTKATEATTAAATATSAKTGAVAANTAAQSAKTAAQTAQAGAETAAASVQSSAAQIQTNADDISELKEELNEVADEFGAIAPYKAYSDSYIDSTGAVASALGHSIYEIPVKYGDIIVISDSGASKFYGSITLGNVFNFKNNDDTYTHLGTGYDTKFVIRTDQDDYMLVIPSGVKCLAVSADDNYYQNVSFRKNYATADFNGMLLKKNGVVSQIDSSWVISSNFYPRSSDGTFRVLTSNVFALAVKSGDIVEFQSLISPYTYYGTFKDKSTLDVANITTAIFTAQSDGYVFAFGDNTSGIVYKPYNGIKIDKRNIVGLSKILDNKIYCAFGDSITAGNNLQTGEVNWTDLVVNELGGTLVNCGVGSSRVAGNQSTAFHKTARLDAVKADNPDIVTILGGANDLVAGYSIGTEAQFDLPIADKDTMTYLGAYSYIIEDLLTWKPSLQIVILGMYYALADGAEYSETLTYAMFSDASKKLAEHYCLPFIDLHHDTGFNQFTMGTSPNNIYTRDKLHPNQLGCNKIASIVIDEFKKLFSL